MDRRKKKLQRRRRNRLAVILLVLMLIFIWLGAKNYMNMEGLGFPGSGDGGRLSACLEDLHSTSAALVDAGTGEKLGASGGSRRIYPASMTKIMTAVVALEHISGLDETITMPGDFYGQLYEENASMAGFEPGEEVFYRELLYGALLPSGAECCMAFAEKIAGSESAFAEMMNKKAQELGMRDTHFTNCTGLHDRRHYSTAEDMARLVVYALQNDVFRQAFTSRSCTMASTAFHPGGFTVTSTLFASLSDPSVPGGEILGGKTGYTEEAGLCLASLAVVNGKEYVLVTAGAPGDHQSEPYHVLDAVKVYGRIGENPE